jgi:P27 family predicted phage terminase small subunit
MANPRKPTSQRRGKAGTTRDIGLVPKQAPAEPPPPLPAKLSGVTPLAATKEAWQRLWESPVARVLDRTSDLGAVIRWAELLDERERAMRAFRKSRLVSGSMGQPTLNPLWQVIASIDKELRQLEDRIGLTPKARLQLGITLAEAGRSIEDLNRMLDEETDADVDEGTPEADPRLRVIDATSR